MVCCRWSAALRPLRDVAKMFEFAPPNKSSLCNRLKYICRAERLAIDSRTLSELASMTDNDVRFVCLFFRSFVHRGWTWGLQTFRFVCRACLNTLQFVQHEMKRAVEGEARPRISAAYLRDLNIGHKDRKRDLRDVWEEIFWKRPTRRRAFYSSRPRACLSGCLWISFVICWVCAGRTGPVRDGATALARLRQEAGAPLVPSLHAAGMRPRPLLLLRSVYGVCVLFAAGTGADTDSAAFRWQMLHGLVMSQETQRILNGVWENYPKCYGVHRDPLLDKVRCVSSMEWTITESFVVAACVVLGLA